MYLYMADEYIAPSSFVLLFFVHRFSSSWPLALLFLRFDVVAVRTPYSE